MKKTPFWECAFLAIAVLALPPTCPGSSGRAARAARAYEAALRLRAALETQPPEQKSRQGYEGVIKAFRNVYNADRAYSKAPVSLALEGELYAEMGRQFHEAAAFERSIQAYQFLIAQYPYSEMAQNALFTIGEIYRNDLQDNEQARKSFQEYLSKFPKSSSAPAAEDNLKEIVKSLTKQSEEESSAASASTASGPDEGDSGPAKVTDIRDWVGPNYTRVVIAVQSPVKFDALRLSHPDRIVFDLPDTRLSRALVGKTFPVEGGFLRQIRIGQFKPDVTRVVLDVQQLDDYSVFPLPNPFRLVIDVHGPAAGQSTELASRERLSKAVERASEHKAEVSSQAEDREVPAPSETSSKEAKRPAQEETAEAGGNQGAERAGDTPPAPSKKNSQRSRKELASLEESSGPRGSAASGTTAPVSIRPAEPTSNGSQTLTRALGLKVARIVIDPGHGGHDTGTIGPTGLEEKTVVLDVAKRLKKLLENETGSDVILTRSTDTFIPLEERTAIANQKGADLFISIHANASRDREARGLETYYLNFTTDPEALEIAARENATSQESVHQLQDLIRKIALSEKVEESQEFARDVQHDLTRRLAAIGDREPNRGVKKAPFVVLIGANMPSILAEISFLTNPHDERLLKKPSFRQQIAEALFRGILDYMRNLGSVNIAERTRSADPSAKDPSPRTPKAPTPNGNF